MILETLTTLHEVTCASEKSNSTFQVLIKADLLDEAATAIRELIMLTETFAEALEIVAGQKKPKIQVDIEKFLSAKSAYQAMDEN